VEAVSLVPNVFGQGCGGTRSPKVRRTKDSRILRLRETSPVCEKMKKKRDEVAVSKNATLEKAKK
jgi:hypothetical protein